MNTNLETLEVLSSRDTNDAIELLDKTLFAMKKTHLLKSSLFMKQLKQKVVRG